jgi:hypothetical protein
MKATGRALVGVVLCALATFGWLEWGERQPELEKLRWLVWCVQALGVATAGRAALRPPPATQRADRFVATLCFALAIGIAGLFFTLPQEAG